MIVIQMLGIPIIAIFLVGAIFVIGATGLEQPGQALRDDQYNLTADEPDLAHTAAPPSLPRPGCNL